MIEPASSLSYLIEKLPHYARLQSAPHTFAIACKAARSIARMLKSLCQPCKRLGVWYGRRRRPGERETCSMPTMGSPSRASAMAGGRSTRTTRGTLPATGAVGADVPVSSALASSAEN